MSRAGREPAEDIKRRLVAACQEVGLTIANANMHLINEAAIRVVHVGASPPGWPHDTAMLSVTANVEMTGQWPRSVDIRCVATEEDDPAALNSPWMQGRHAIPLESLIEHLQETLKERREVLELTKAGAPGPYVFSQTVWQRVDLFGDMDDFEPADGP